MITNFAMVFPGQGSQSVGMLSELAEYYPQVKSLFDKASTQLGYDLWSLVQVNSENKLDQTEYTQPALLTADVAVWECWLAAGGPKPEIMAGHSLGEYSALVCANAVSFEDALALVAARGRYMQEAVSPGEGAMAAIVGLDMPVVAELCAKSESYGVVSPANYNSIGQTVIAGQTAAVEQVVALAQAEGAKFAKILPVSVPSHCALMDTAAQAFKHDLARAEFKAPTIPVLHNADMSSHDEPQSIRSRLLEQLVSPVRLVETIQLFAGQGIELILECGPGKVLAGLNKRITTVKTYSINDSTSLNEALSL